MMRKTMMAAGICLMMLLGLSACTRLDGQAGAGSGGTGSSGAGGTVSSQSGDTGNAGAQNAEAQNAGSQNTGTGNADAQNSGTQNAGTGNADAQPGENGEIGNDGAPSLSQDDGGEEDDGAVYVADDDSQEVGPDATYDTANQAGDAPVDTAALEDDGWDGTFQNASGETLTISSDGGSSLSFSFAVSGIGGSASADGDLAYFGGDDGNTVVLENLGGSIEVSVTNAEGGEEASAISGSYMRQ